MNRQSARIAFLAAALCLPLGLSACGVKGPLSPPAGANAAAGNGEEAEPTATAGAPAGQASNPTRLGAGTTNPAVVHAPAAARRNPLDWLID